VTEAPASCCLRIRVGELEILYTMRDVSDAELTGRVQHLVPWVQDLFDQARERQALLETLRQQREAAHPTAPVPPALPTPTAPPDLQALVQHAVQQALAAQAPGTGTLPTNGQAASAHTDAAQSTGAEANGGTHVCQVHQVPLELRRNARGSWWSHWVASEKRYCKGD
jgi:hypothetical protein